MSLRSGLNNFSQAVDEFGGITPTLETLELTPTPVKRPLVISEDTGIGLPEAIKRTIIEWSLQEPTWGPVRIANHLQPYDERISPAMVRLVWQKYALSDVQSRINAQQRLDIFASQRALPKRRPSHAPKVRELVSIALWLTAVCLGLAYLVRLLHG